MANRREPSSRSRSRREHSLFALVTWPARCLDSASRENAQGKLFQLLLRKVERDSEWNRAEECEAVQRRNLEGLVDWCRGAYASYQTVKQQSVQLLWVPLSGCYKENTCKQTLTFNHAPWCLQEVTEASGRVGFLDVTWVQLLVFVSTRHIVRSGDKLSYRNKRVFALFLESKQSLPWALAVTCRPLVVKLKWHEGAELFKWNCTFKSVTCKNVWFWKDK